MQLVRVCLCVHAHTHTHTHQLLQKPKGATRPGKHGEKCQRGLTGGCEDLDCQEQAGIYQKMEVMQRKKDIPGKGRKA